MNTIFLKAVRSPKFGALLLCCLVLASRLAAQAATIYDSRGFEIFLPSQMLDGQDAAPPGNGPWAQDNGTSTAEVTAANPIEGNLSVKITRAAGDTGDTRWGVMKSVAPAGLNNVVNVYFDMRAVRQANEFGPLFGIEAYDASAGAPKLIGSLLLDASTGQILCHAANTSTFRGTGAYLDVIRHHHYRLTINFTTRTCSLFADGDLLHTEGFVNASATQFTDAPLTTLAIDAANNNAGIAYFDNYRIEHTTSQLPYLLWKGDGSANNWDLGASTNWFDGIAPVTFNNGAEVRFDDSGSVTPSVQLQGNLLPGSIEVVSARNYEFSGTGSINGAADLVKRGTGTLILSNTNGYTGETKVLKGGLSIRNTTGSATGTNRVSVFPMCTVSGNGTIGGSLWVASGGVVQPGVNGPGTLTVADQLVLDDAALKFDLGTSSDRLVARGDLTLGGTLTITDAGGFGPGTYTLITYGGELAAGTLLVTAAPAGYDYTVSTNTPGKINLIVALPPSPPAAPGALAATTISTSQIDLNWSDNSTNESYFLIERSQDNMNFSQIATTGTGVTSYSNAGLSPGTTYYYRVRASNAGGNSPYSNVASATTTPSEAVAWYEFEMTPLDSSGNNNHAVPVGTLLYGPGKRGSDAAQFNGTAFAEITRIIGTNFTVAMWLKTTNTGPASGAWYAGMGLVDGEVAGSAADWGCSVINSKFVLGIGNPDTTISSTVNISDGNWHHVAATRVSDTGAVKLYVDGVLNVSTTAPMGPRTSPNELRIGATHINPPVFYVGSLDDLRLYDRALSASEIAELVTPNTPPTISSIPDQSTPIDNSVGPIDFTIGDVETPAEWLTVSGYSSNSNLVPNANITFGGSGSNRTVTVTPAPGQFGTANITVKVSDAQASTSTAFKLTVVAEPPVITSQPQSQTVTVGSNVTFSVTATGTAPLSYQWRFNGANITGATSASYSIASAQLSDAGNYSVVVANVAGSATSATATLTVNVNATFSGRAFALNANILGVTNTWSDTGELPSSGGARESTLLTIDEADVLAGDVGHASVIGQGDRTRAEASGANVAVVIGNVTVSADFAMARATAIWQTNGTAVSGGSEITGLLINGLPVIVSGQPNQTVPLLNGRVVINEQTPTATSITVKALHIVINGVADVVVASARAGIASNEKPTCAGEDYVTGGGWITTTTGAKGNFSVEGGATNGVVWGHLTYKDNGTGMKVKGTSVTAYRVGATPNARHIEGTAEIDGATGHTYSVDVEDNGQPGRNDVFTIHLSNGYEAGGSLGGGNIQLHKPCE